MPMNTPKRNTQNPQIQVDFIKQQKIKQHAQLQNKLHFQILRVAGSEKQSAIKQICQMDQDEIVTYFMQYQCFPEAQFTVQELKQSKRIKLIRNNGKVYFGEVYNRQMHGMGICFYPEGKLYEGTFVGNKKDGMGCEVYENGNIYIGEFFNNKKHGRGQFFWFSVSTSDKLTHYQYYDGEWWGGLPDGKAVHQKADGDIYEGTFKNGLKHGFGQQRYANGDHYEGQYVNGLPQGIGTYSWKDGSSYKGDFKQGLRNGFGTWRMNNNENSEVYQGRYCMDKKSGYGQYTWANGWKYKGNFQNDQREGYGELFDYNSCVYKGNWSRGEKIQQRPNNIVKVSRIIDRHKIKMVQRQEIQIEDISQTINTKKQKINFQKLKQHQLLTRPGFLIRRPTKNSLNLDRYQSCNKNNKRQQFQSQNLLTSRVGTQINRPYSKISLQSAKTLKYSRAQN